MTLAAGITRLQMVDSGTPTISQRMPDAIGTQTNYDNVSPISQIPHEILTRILIYSKRWITLELQPRHTELRLVCKLWDHAVLNFPEMWRDVYIPLVKPHALDSFPGTSTHLEDNIARSGILPLRVQLDLCKQPRFPHTFLGRGQHFPAIKESGARWEELSIRTEALLSSRAMLDSFPRSLPILNTLSIGPSIASNSNDASSMFRISLPLLRDLEMPSLTQLRLINASLMTPVAASYFPLPWFAQLTLLEIRTLKLSLSLDSTIGMLSHMENLRSLSIGFGSQFHAVDFPLTTLPPPTIILPNVETLKIIRHPSTVAVILACLTCPRLRHLEIIPSGPESPNNDHERSQGKKLFDTLTKFLGRSNSEFTLKTLKIGTSSCDEVSHLLSILPAVEEAKFRFFESPAKIFAWLTISEADSHTPRAPNLQRLVVEYPRSSYVDTFRESVFVMAHSRLPDVNLKPAFEPIKRLELCAVAPASVFNQPPRTFARDLSNFIQRAKDRGYQDFELNWIPTRTIL